MSPVRSLVPVAVGLAVVAGLGVAHGLYTDRWGPSGQLQDALDRLDRVNQSPVGYGEWAVVEDVPLEDAALARGGIRGYVQRRFRNTATGEAVTLLIVCGRGGPISVHTPDVCYAGAGYRQVGAEGRAAIPGGPGGAVDDYVTGRFTLPNAVVPTQLEIFWAWSTDGVTWHAPASPRREYARVPAVYKMYVVREFVPGSKKAEEADGCRAFLTQALPALRKTLPAAPAAGDAR